MTERRTLERRHLTWYCRVEQTGPRRELGRLADIHTEGLMLVTPDALPLGARFEVEVVVPSGVSGLHQPIPAVIEVRWVRPDVNPGLQAIGCQFVAPLVDAAAVRALITLLGFDG
jgi:hypothetical protein